MAISEKRLYQRYSIILHQGDRGYEISEGKQPTGYAKIEIRSNNGRMTALFQNLKQIDDVKGFYKAYIVSKSGGSVTPVKVGLVEVDKWGKGNIEWRFNPSDVGGSGLDIEKFNIVTLVHIPETLDKDANIRFPLVGHLKKGISVQWKEEVIKQLMAIAGIMPGILNPEPEQDEAEQDLGAKLRDKTEDKAVGGTGDWGEGEIQVNGDTLSSDEVNVNGDTYSEYHGLPLDKVDDLPETAQLKGDEPEERFEAAKSRGQDSRGDVGDDAPERGDKEGYARERFDTLRDSHDDRRGDEDTPDKANGETAGIQTQHRDTHQSPADDDVQRTGQDDTRDKVYDEDRRREQEDARDEAYDGAQRAGQDGVGSEAYERDQREKRDDVGIRGEDFGDRNKYASWYAADKGQVGYRTYGYSFWDRMEWYYKRLFNSYMSVQPFEKEMKDVEWIRVDIHKNYNPAYGQNYFMNQFYGFMANPYDHYIIGLQRQEGKPKYIIYGMPGRYIREEQPFGGQTGYTYWQPAKGQQQYPGAFGYWMAYIDVISGTIAFPEKPTYL